MSDKEIKQRLEIISLNYEELVNREAGQGGLVVMRNFAERVCMGRIE